MNDGPFLLLDEPMAGVDGKNYEILLGVIREEAVKGRGICVIEHNMSFMAEMVQELVFLFNGKAEAQGRPRRFLQMRDFAGSTLAAPPEAAFRWTIRERRRPASFELRGVV